MTFTMKKNDKKNKKMKFALCTCVAVVALTSPLYAAENAQCARDGFCAAPQEMGLQDYNSRVTVRDVGQTPSNVEYREMPDEVLDLYGDDETPDTKAQTGNFKSGRHMLSDVERTMLEKFVSRIAQKNVSRIEIIGHADKQRINKNALLPYKDNDSLSAARAQEAGKYIKTLLKDENAPIFVFGKGDAEPVVGGCEDTKGDMAAFKSCLQPNRRVEILVWYTKAGSGCGGKQAVSSSLPFRISVDGEPVETADSSNSADLVRCTDVSLEKADIQVRFDSLEDTRALNVTSVPQTAVAYEGDVTFTPYGNYQTFIDRAEVRIFSIDQSVQDKPLAVLELDKALGQDVKWSPRSVNTKDVTELQYVLRVYSKHGDFDETAPKLLKLVEKSEPQEELESPEREKLTGYGENHIALKNIKVQGGIVTVNGDHLTPNSKVWVMGKSVPVDENGRFAHREILESGNHDVAVVTESPDGTRAEFSRPLYIPYQDWFYVALADLTIGKNAVNGPAKLVTGDTSNRYDEKAFADGRLAYYAKGKIKGEWLLTSSADTQEQPVEDLFTNFSSKDPRYLLKRIDPNAYYPVYGDDSTAIEDAPTQGKFYVKLERGDSHVMWGNFQTKITGTDLVNYSRTLYGANGEYVSEATTNLGEKKTEANVFAADPGSLSSLEEFRGTGGSLYYVRGQDVVKGSERIRIEVRDQDSGIVLSSRELVYGQDYEFNYMQGRVILREPLSSVSTAETVVRSGSLSGNPVYLVVGYEYTPSVTNIDNLTKGGRVTHWINDYVRVGGTVYEQDGTGVSQKLGGLDALVRYTPNTYVKVEGARSSDVGSGAFSSINGGFDFGALSQTRTPKIDADAYRAEIGVDLADVTKDKMKGKVSAYTLRREDGFSAPGQLTSEEITQHGMQAAVPVNDKLELGAKVDLKSGDTTGDVDSGEISGHYQLTPEQKASVAFRHDDRETDLAAGNSSILAETGGRTDMALKLLHAPIDDVTGVKESYEVYGLGQVTLDKDSGRSRNNRAGVGGLYDLNDSISLTGETTAGSGGWGGLLGAEYAPSDRTSYYTNYQMDTQRSDIGLRGKNSSFTLGAKKRYSDSLSVFSEERHQSFDNGPSGLIHSFGLDLAADDKWTWGGRFENGTLSDATSGDIDRTAVSLTSGYEHEKTKYAGTVELRYDESDVLGDRTSWLMKNNYAYQTTPDWRFLGNFDFAISESGLSSDLDADFTEIGLGYAYRPVENDRLNALIAYKFLQDDASSGQLAPNHTESASGYEQRSHVLSADAIYDVVPKLGVGGKIGYRFGEIRDTEVAGSEWFDSQALLLIGRADYHVVKEWDATGELRMLDASEAEDRKVGALLGVYKHIQDHAKIGVGYNFTDFSDDLTDLDYDSKGFFVNFVGKF